MFSDCAIRNCGPTFWNSLDKTLKHCKTTKHFRNQLKSILLSEYNWLHFGACLVCFCVLCQFVKCIILQVCWNLCKGHDFSQAFMAFWSCPQYHVVFFMPVCFVVWYWNKVWYDVWYDMIYDMICMFLEVNPWFQKAHIFCMDLQPAADPYSVVCTSWCRWGSSYLHNVLWSFRHAIKA